MVDLFLLCAEVQLGHRVDGHLLVTAQVSHEGLVHFPQPLIPHARGVVVVQVNVVHADQQMVLNPWQQIRGLCAEGRQ